eukprot:CAMPEP_0177217832 /NCGR_PEP_ID=MMETSP0367-20130122/35492_1 /TAXON_ID=447022 ORGANISM="Scrippsiella hangoei-like, Strain SHHI-4" /NCGR_SAMPLE_ID=MMETSP0367 /ASSEMBLY_ACC=CAM_ASM_000362 /LENGTH=360 /DNA_ID=CAMNT_0018667423 /DNA_START=9 /DNA_END=1091 /DNA_ORIENTATION=+
MDHLKLIDFGFAKFWDHSTKMSQACGSVHYVAPEVLAHSYTEKADMWSLGRKIRAGQPNWSSRFQKLSAPAQHFVKSLLVLDPNKRYSSEGALNDDWIKARDQKATPIDSETLENLRTFGHSSSFKRAVLSMMAWSLDAEDRLELRQMFLSMDKEKRGTITLPQMKEVLEELFHIDHTEAERIFKSIDKNNDNEIAYTEFLAAACVGRVKVHEDLLRKTFSKFDTHQSGKVSADDLKLVLGDEFEGVKMESLISQVDANHDGSVDYEEFITYFHKHENESADVFDPDSEKHQHIEKICQVVDRLARARTESFAIRGEGDTTPVGVPRVKSMCSPTATPRSLVRRNAKAATFCMGVPNTSQ